MGVASRCVVTSAAAAAAADRTVMRMATSESSVSDKTRNSSVEELLLVLTGRQVGHVVQVVVIC